ncbi:helix-turn-helix transcriptional regulator [Anoxybacterium hadale]|uniref:Helix-turn-helix transcriptional regulator n=1 Tax=Anoxybacterium hadale TaxID=3408580 RepID=A0ACD1AG09_9FIRM|nr:helix-turn-helix transcriptional regulator [Clostridiales bacterium]
MSASHAEKYKQIGQKIAYYRTQRGLTQQQLADEIGISKSYLSKIESPNTNKPFSLDVLFSLSETLNIKIIDFFKDID